MHDYDANSSPTTLPDYPEGVLDTLEGDLYLDEAHWAHFDAAQKCCSHARSLAFPETSWGTALDIGSVWPALPAESSGEAFAASAGAKKKLNRERKEASKTDVQHYAKYILQAKLDEYKSWADHEVFDLVDLRKTKPRNYVTGRWVLTIKRNKDGTFQKCKARWVLRGFQDKQQWDQQTDSPTTTRPGFRLTCQLAANQGWSIRHVDLKTAFLQGEEYGSQRDVICQLPPEAGHPPHIGARLKKPAYGMNDAPRRWWNRLDKSLTSYGLVPTRAPPRSS